MSTPRSRSFFWFVHALSLFYLCLAVVGISTKAESSGSGGGGDSCGGCVDSGATSSPAVGDIGRLATSFGSGSSGTRGTGSGSIAFGGGSRSSSSSSNTCPIMDAVVLEGRGTSGEGERQRERGDANGAPSASSSSAYLVYSSEGSSYLADLIAAELNMKRGAITRSWFKGGEKYYRIEMDERDELVGRDVIYVCSTVTDDDLLELVRLGCAFAAYGSRRRIFIIPFLGYSTMERQVLPGEVVTAKVNARIMSSIPNSKLGNVFVFMDLHVQSLLQYLEGPCVRMELYAEHELLEAIRREVDLSQPFMFASADLGRPLWVESFARKFNVDVAFVRKSRKLQETSVMGVVGDVAGKHVVIYDDMTRTGGTLIKAAEAYFSKGATRVTAVLSHFALATEDVVEKLAKSCISLIIATNSHPMSQSQLVLSTYKDKFRIIDSTPIFTSSIRKLMQE